MSVLLEGRGITKRFGTRVACADVHMDVWPGEVVAIVGESGSGKTTLLRCLSGQLAPSAGCVRYRLDGGALTDLAALDTATVRRLTRTEWGFVFQDPTEGLRMGISAGGNIGERLMAVGARHYGAIRTTAADWMEKVEVAPERIDEPPRVFSGGMRQRLQIARNLVTGPRLVFLDEPTGGLDVSVQARVLDVLRRLTRELHLAAVLVTHDLGVARLLADRMMVMKDGAVVEEGLTDRVLEDPQHPYTQLLVSSILTA